jgi:hypothetical protein
VNLRLWLGLYAPGRKRGLARRRIVFDAVDRLSAQASGLRDLGNAGGLAEHVPHRPELLASEARLAAQVFASAICHSLNPEGSSYSTSSVASMSAPQSLSPPISHSVNGRASSVIPR